MKNLLFIILSITTIINLHAADITSINAIVRAIENKEREKVSQLLNNAKIDINIKLSPVGSLLLYSISNESEDAITIDLIEAGANVNYTQHPYNQTPLHYAAYYNKPAVVQKLLEYGANREIKDLCDQTPAYLARAKGRSETAQLIDNYDDGRDIKQPDQES